MESQTQGALKYPTSTLIRSSSQLGWSKIFADLRSHRNYEGPGVLGAHVEVAITVFGSDEGIVTCKVGGEWHRVRPTTGTIWLVPSGTKSEEMRISSPEFQILHLYVPVWTFARLHDDYNLPSAPGQSIRYSCGAQDDIIRQISLSVLSEMEYPTSAGRMLVETSSLFLAARLIHAHCETKAIGKVNIPRNPLDTAKLRRVLAYVRDHLAEEITVADLAGVACLSIFHFTRAFAAAMGMPPHRYLSQQRLEAAKAMISAGNFSLSEIAFRCRFSSQASFTRAFRRAAGIPPAEYRRQLR